MKTISLLLLIFLSFSLPGGAAEKESKANERFLPSVNLPPIVEQLLKTGQWEAAIEGLEAAYESTVADINLKYYLSYCYEQMAAASFKEKNYQNALEHINNAIHYVDDNPQMHWAAGMCYFLMSQYSQAQDSFSETIRLKPNHFEAHKQLAEVYYINNENHNAIAHWQEALKLKPEDTHVKQRLKKIKKLMELSQDFDKEIGTSFLLTFNGKEAPGLREEAMKSLEEIYQYILQQLNLYPTRQISVVLLANQEFFNITESPDWVGGVYEGQIKIPVSNYKTKMLKIVLCHEYIHAVIFDRLSVRCPWWLNEGLAQYFSRDHEGNLKKLELAANIIKQGYEPDLAVLPGALFNSKEGVKKAYALALSAVDYLIKSQSVFDLQSILDLMGEGKSLSTAIKEITAFSFAEFQANWVRGPRGQ